MIFYFVLVASTLSFAQGEVHHDRKIFQPFVTKNSTPAYQLISSTPQSQQKRREREILAERESRNLSGGESEIPAVANHASGTQLVTFDSGEEEWAEYEDDYQLLKEEYERNQWQEKKSNVTAEDARLDKDDCFWLFCSVSKKFVFIVMSIVALIIFWCYLGKYLLFVYFLNRVQKLLYRYLFILSSFVQII